MKKISLLVSASFLATSLTYSLPVHANSFYDFHSSQQIAKTIDLSDLSQLPDGVKVSGVMTYDELIEQIAKDNNISLVSAKSLVSSSNQNNFTASAQAAATYRTITSSFTVTSTFTPYMRFYCQTDEGGGFRAIEKVISHNLVRQDERTNVTKQFSGNVESHLEHQNKIHYIVNGDFYNNGTTNYSGGGAINVGLWAKLNFTVSGANSHYKYVYLEKDLLF
ncbi:hypothetical protein L2089_00855 [Paenibacillus hunanensis]|uniref:hypothetical protein n=1 Tax=Paenibacillus hunanensis TaxID=539262 RepID=UPI0020261703|nr:hypothetical protein [Paenibacillus hunanensis]MCL9659217.1 hypothetical protein [Paenibacillus hunanensis]